MQYSLLSHSLFTINSCARWFALVSYLGLKIVNDNPYKNLAPPIPSFVASKRLTYLPG